MLRRYVSIHPTTYFLVLYIAIVSVLQFSGGVARSVAVSEANNQLVVTLLAILFFALNLDFSARNLKVDKGEIWIETKIQDLVTNKASSSDSLWKVE